MTASSLLLLLLILGCPLMMMLMMRGGHGHGSGHADHAGRSGGGPEHVSHHSVSELRRQRAELDRAIEERERAEEAELERTGWGSR